jgi:hypothetical protein
LALQTSNDLTAGVANWLNRDDLSARIPEFIELLEGDLRRRLRRGVTRADITLDSGAVALPSTVAEVRYLRLNTGPTHRDTMVYPRTPEELNELRASVHPTGRPRYFSVVNNTLLLVPAPSESFTAEIVYFTKYVPVSASQPGLIPTAPDMYLFGTLAIASSYLEHDERIQQWVAWYDDALKQLNRQREEEEFGLSLMPMRLPVVFG